MPLYEYFCPTCSDTFEQLRPAQKADDTATCPACTEPAAHRVLSLFASGAKGADGMTMSPAMAQRAPMGGSCCGGGCGCH